MATAIFINGGMQIDYKATANVAEGDVIVVSGAVLGVSPYAITSGGVGGIQTRGVFDVAKAASVSFSVGDAVYFDPTSAVATNVSSGNVALGTAIADVTSGGTAVRVLIK